MTIQDLTEDQIIARMQEITATEQGKDSDMFNEELMLEWELLNQQLHSLRNQDLSQLTDNQLIKRINEITSLITHSGLVDLSNEWEQLYFELHRRHEHPEHDERDNWPEPLN